MSTDSPLLVGPLDPARVQPVIVRCPKCRHAVITDARADVWCLPCGVRMAPLKGRPTANFEVGATSNRHYADTTRPLSAVQHANLGSHQMHCQVVGAEA